MSIDDRSSPRSGTPESTATGTETERSLREGARAAGDQARAAARDAKDAASSAAGGAKDKAAETISAQTEEKGNMAADRVEEVAEAVRSSAGNFTGREEWLAGLINEGADELGQLANMLRTNDLRALLGHVEDFARRQPQLFAGVALAAGFAAARVAKAGLRSGAIQSGLSDMAETVSDAASETVAQARDKAQEVAGKAGDAASEAVGRAGDAAKDAVKEAAPDTARDAAATTPPGPAMPSPGAFGPGGAGGARPASSTAGAGTTTGISYLDPVSGAGAARTEKPR